MTMRILIIDRSVDADDLCDMLNNAAIEIGHPLATFIAVQTEADVEAIVVSDNAITRDEAQEFYDDAVRRRDAEAETAPIGPFSKIIHRYAGHDACPCWLCHYHDEIEMGKEERMRGVPRTQYRAQSEKAILITAAYKLGWDDMDAEIRGVDKSTTEE